MPESARRISRTRTTTTSSNGQKGWNGEWHPFALRFGGHSDDEIAALAASIKTYGQREPCKHLPDGTGIDGTGRVSACALLGIEPQWEVVEPNGNLEAYIWDMNERRDLNESQRTMMRALRMKEQGLRVNGKWEPGAVKAQRSGSGSSKISPQRLAEAGVVLDHLPEPVWWEVLSGESSLDGAYKSAQPIKKRKEALANLRPDLLKMVNANNLSLEEAEDRQEQEERIGELENRYPDLARQVREGELSFEDALEVAEKSDERREAWVSDIQHSLQVIRDMAGYPVPEEIKTDLEEEDLRDLTAFLRVLKGTK